MNCICHTTNSQVYLIEGNVRVSNIGHGSPNKVRSVNAALSANDFKQ